MKPLFVQWGGGNIGRSFIAQVFCEGGYRVRFIDVNQELIDALNESGTYTVETVSATGREQIPVTNVSAIHGSDQEAVNAVITETDLMGVSVGKNIWPFIAASLAEAIVKRHEQKPDSPLDIILAENIHGGRQFVTGLLKTYLPQDFPLETYVGLVETSIGKMVPLQKGEDLLLLRAEPYRELIVNRDAFHVIPQIPALKPASPIEAYVDRKLFIHNLGHAAAAYLGYRAHPESIFIADVLQDTSVLNQVRETMSQAAEILLILYPEVFTEDDLKAHIEDLLIRFCNPLLEDTVFRVGRDLRRKLRYDDRLLGIILEAQKCAVPWNAIARAYLAGLSFTAADRDGKQLESDISLLTEISGRPFEEQLRIASDWETSGIGEATFQALIQGFHL